MTKDRMLEIAQAYYKCVSNNRNCHLECYECLPCSYGGNKNICYEDEEKEFWVNVVNFLHANTQNRMIITPCAEGSDVYKILRRKEEHYYGEYLVAVRKRFCLADVEELGKSVFLTSEEAEHEIRRRTFNDLH